MSVQTCNRLCKSKKTVCKGSVTTSKMRSAICGFKVSAINALPQNSVSQKIQSAVFAPGTTSAEVGTQTGPYSIPAATAARVYRKHRTGERNSTARTNAAALIFMSKRKRQQPKMETTTAISKRHIMDTTCRNFRQVEAIAPPIENTKASKP